MDNIVIGIGIILSIGLSIIAFKIVSKTRNIHSKLTLGYLSDAPIEAEFEKNEAIKKESDAVGTQSTNELKEFFSAPYRRRQIIIGSILIVNIIFILPFFFDYMAKIKGVKLNDFILDHIHSSNVSIFIFLIIWGVGGLLFWRAIHRPIIYLNYLWSLIFIDIVRCTMLLFFPIAPPTGSVPLVDPISTIFYGEYIRVFPYSFSGHIATVTIAILCLEKKSDRTIATLATIVLSILLLIQHADYTIGILTAPVVSYIVFRLVNYFLNKSNQSQIVLIKSYYANIALKFFETFNKSLQTGILLTIASGFFDLIITHKISSIFKGNTNSANNYTEMLIWAIIAVFLMTVAALDGFIPGGLLRIIFKKERTITESS